MAGVGTAVCPSCQVAVDRFSPQKVAERLTGVKNGKKFMVCFATPSENQDFWPVDLREARQQGFRRAIIQEKIIDLAEIDEVVGKKDLLLDSAKADSISTSSSKKKSSTTAQAAESNDTANDSATPSGLRRPLIVVDRLSTTGNVDDPRVLEALEIAFQFGWGECYLLVQSPTSAENELGDDSHRAGDALFAGNEKDTDTIWVIEGRRFQLRRFTSALNCPQCGQGFPNPQRQFFQPQRLLSAGNDATTLDDAPLTSHKTNCHWHPASDIFRWDSYTINQLYDLPLQQLADWLQQLELSPNEAAICKGPLKQIQSRLSYLNRIGLGYLPLHRPLHSTSRGERQRLLLTKCLGSSLTEILYVLDEPSRGLHPVDMPRLIQAISELHQGKTEGYQDQQGSRYTGSNRNTIVVVDHQQEMLQAAERVIEIGPHAGAEGGEIVFDGSPEQLSTSNTHTGRYWQGCRSTRSESTSLTLSRRQNRSPAGWVKLKGARANNLKSIDVDFPLGCLTVIVGVSGAGKTSLLRQELFPRLNQCFHPTCDRNKSDDVNEARTKSNERRKSDSLAIEAGRLEEVVYVDQTPIGNCGRSNPMTFIKAYDEIRKVFAETQDAQQRNLKPADFSFNLKSGRCPRCEGTGQLKVEMQFMADLFLTCDQCQGARFCDRVLNARYRSLSIANVLNLTVREAFSFFRGKPKLQTKLKTLIDVGLDYIRLGQPANRLSGGEAQRLRLAQYLAVPRSKPTMFLMEEPTSGLHRYDIDRFLECLEVILSVGHSLVIVEHNLHFIRHADWIIELGPAADQHGGKLIAVGRPNELVSNSASIIGPFL